MTVRELIEKLQELENQNPANSYRPVIFYYDFETLDFDIEHVEQLDNEIVLS